MGVSQFLNNYIDGSWKNSQATDALEVLNPATTEVLAQVPLSPALDVQEATRAASVAFESWRLTPAGERIQYLFKLKALLEERLEEISRIITMESGKTLEESRGEVRRAIENVEVACGIPTMMQGQNLEDMTPGIDELMICQLVERHRAPHRGRQPPVGVVAVIAPFNFPAMISFWFLPYASFVGSTPIARYVYSRATANGKRAQCQGGAKNPIIILPDADMEMTTRITADSAFGCAGQRCLAASLAITVGEARDPFTEALAEAASSRVVGYGLEDGVQMGPVITTHRKSRIEGLIEMGSAEGADLLVDGRGASVPGYEKKKLHRSNRSAGCESGR